MCKDKLDIWAKLRATCATLSINNLITILCMRWNSDILNNNIGFGIYSVWNIQTFQNQVINHSTGSIFKSFIFLVMFQRRNINHSAASFGWNRESMRSASLRYRPNIPREHLFYQALKFTRRCIKWSLFLKQKEKVKNDVIDKNIRKIDLDQYIENKPQQSEYKIYLIEKTECQRNSSKMWKKKLSL